MSCQHAQSRWLTLDYSEILGPAKTLSTLNVWQSFLNLSFEYYSKHFGFCYNHGIVRTELLTLSKERKGNFLFNDTLNTFYLQLYGVRHIVKDHSDSERENPLPPYGLLFSIDSKDSFICTIPQTG